MSVKNSIKLLLFILLVIGNASAQAQGDCSESLRDAERSYYLGRFYEVENKLLPCISLGVFSTEQLTLAYRLLALSRIFKKQLPEADSAIYSMYTHTPTYRNRPMDPPELKSRLNRFRVFPLLDFHTGISTYIPDFNIIEVYSLRNIPSNIVYTGNPGVKINFGTEFYLTPRITLGVSFDHKRFSFNINDRNEITETRLDEQQLRNQLSLGAGYRFPLGNEGNIIVKSGIGFDWLRQSTSDLYKLEQETGSAYADDPERNNPNYSIIYRENLGFSNLNQRQILDIRPYFHLGYMVSLPNQFNIQLFTRLEQGLRNNTRNRGSNYDQVFTYEWIEDDFKINSLEFGISLHKFIYRIKSPKN